MTDQHRMRALVLWADDRSANLGVRALAQGAASLITQAFGDDVDIDFQDLAPNESGFNPTIDVVKRDLRSRTGPIKTWLRPYDLVVDTGAGDSFADIYGWRRVFRMIYVQVTARRLGIPVVLAPQTLGPFVTRRMRAAAWYALRRASVVAPRDTASADFARSLGRRDLVASTDVVFALPRPARTERHDVLLNVSGLLWATDGHGDSVRYQAAVRGLIAGLQARGRGVTLLAHVIENGSVDNDVPTVVALGDELGLPVIVPADLAEVRRAVSGAKLVVGARMHACLNAISTGTPAIAWAYSRKFAPLLGDIGWPYTVDLATSDDPAAETLAIVDSRQQDEFEAEVQQVLTRTAARITPVVAAVRLLLPLRSAAVPTHEAAI